MTGARECRGCGRPLATTRARRYRGRFVGACRDCESAEALSRYYRDAVQGDLFDPSAAPRPVEEVRPL